MNTDEEIREYFAAIPFNGTISIESLPKEYEAFVVKTSEGYGVAIPTDEQQEISEKFNSVRLKTIKLSINGEDRNYLYLTSAFEEFRYEFASICAEFVDPGKEGSNRKGILKDPYGWWTKWKNLLGNSIREIPAYSVIGEMLALDCIYKQDHSAEWASNRLSSHDIECSNESYEVKSTLKKYGSSITVSGQHQLINKKRLLLLFCRLEESQEGISINDAKDSLVTQGYSEFKIEKELERLGYEKGATIRNKKYKVLEKRKYEVDDDFPKIVKESFKGDKFPLGITHITYTIDLDGIKYTTW